MPAYLRAVRANRAYVDADGARRLMARAALRPQRYGPPRLLRPRVDIRAERRHGWPVYTVTPRGRSSRGGLVYVHGGGWVGEIVLQHWQLVAQLADEAGVAVTVPIYPLVPLGTAGEVVPVVADLVRESIAEHGPTCVGGDSAGGQVSLSAAMLLRDAGVRLPLTVLIAPALDLTFGNPQIPVVQPTDPWLGVPGARVLAEHWAGDLTLTDPVVSPIFGELAGLGPVLLLNGTRDIVGPDGDLLASRAAEAGVRLEHLRAEGELHVHPLLPTRAGREARATIVERVREAVSGA